MRKLSFTLLSLFLSLCSFAQLDPIRMKIDSIEKTFTYVHGEIALRNGIGKLTIPEGFKYLDPIQAERVLVELWGNPKGSNLTMGLILPEDQGVLSRESYVFNVQYDEIGYVKDNDAEDIKYDDLLVEMKKEAEEANKERQKAGYEAISIIGWAAKPFYDKDRKILHWAKEIKFGNDSVNTLNYNIRILGRKGVLVLNAICQMQNLPVVLHDLPKVLNIVKFGDGYTYKDFNPSVDQVAAWTIGGLVVGKILAKVGLFALVLKFWKIIGLAIFGFFAAFKKKLSRKKSIPLQEVDMSHIENSEITDAQIIEETISTQADRIEQVEHPHAKNDDTKL